MANKNKFTITMRALNMIILFILLNSCQTKGNGYNMMHTENHSSINGIHTKNGIHTNLNLEQVICSGCGQGARFLYKLADKKNSIVLICEECEAIWPNPENIGSNGATTDEKLASMLGVVNTEGLFNNSDWATKEEAESSKWKELLQNNMVLVK